MSVTKQIKKFQKEADDEINSEKDGRKIICFL